MGKRNHVTIVDSISAQMRREMSSVDQANRVRLITDFFKDKVTKVVEELKSDLLNRLNTLEANENIPSIIKEKKRLEILDDLRKLENPDTAWITAINTLGVNKIKDKIKYNFTGYLEEGIEANIARETKGVKGGEGANRYVSITLKRDYKDDYDETVRKYVEHKRAEYEKVVKFFDPLFTQAFPKIEQETGISLSNVTATEKDYRTDSEGNPLEDSDNEIGESYKDGWLTKARYVNPHSTLSKRVKLALSGIPEMNGKKAKFDDIGNIRRMTASRVYTILLTEAHKLHDVENFTTQDNPVLFFERLASKYLWAKQVIKNLKNEDGSYNIPLISEMFSCLRMQFVPYFVSRDDYITAANVESGYEGTLQKTRTNIERGYRLNKSMSLYSENQEINQENIPKLEELWEDIYHNFGFRDELDSNEIKDVAKNLSKLLRAIGFEISDIDAENLLNDSERLVKFINNSFEDIGTLLDVAKKHTSVFDFTADTKNVYGNLAYDLNIVGQEDLKTSFFNAGKQKYSFSYPNYVHQIISGLNKDAFNTKSSKPGYKSLFDQTLHEEFMQDPFFYRKDANGEYKFYSIWLRLLERSGEVRDRFTHVQLDSINGYDYTDWTPEMIYSALNNAFEDVNVNKHYSGRTSWQYGYYHMPIFSDSPAMILIRAPKLPIDNDTVEGASVMSGLTDVAMSELYRINRLFKRAEKIKEGLIQPITNYDIIYDKNGNISKINGAEFKFFPALNSTTVRDKDGKSKPFLVAINDLLINKDIKGAEALMREKLKGIMEQGFEEFMADAGEYFTNPREYYYNSVLATSQIIMLTTTDLAFYKNAIDFQKRFKEVYAAGKRFNTNSELGTEFRRVGYLRDQYLPSRSIGRLQKSLESNPNLDRNAVDYILSKLKGICVTDAQAFLSPKAYEKMLDMLGQLTPESKEAFERFRESAELVRQGKQPTWTAADFQVVWQTFKPFMYTQLTRPDGLDEGGMLKNPLQHKNSEIMITALLNLVQGAYSKSPKLNALVEFMEAHDIDSFMFETAVKVGGHSFTDLNFSPGKYKQIISKPTLEIGGNKISTVKDGEPKSAKDIIREVADLVTDKKLSEDEYLEFMDSLEPTKAEVMKMLEESYLRNGELDESRFDMVPYKDVMIAQENPEHLVDTQASFGSQFANIIFSDFNPNNPIRLSDGTVISTKEAKRIFEECRVENIRESYTELIKTIGSKEKFYDMLRDTINKNPSYNQDLAKALELVDDVDKNGNPIKVLNFPTYTPSMSKKLSQLIFSMFKNRVTKQKINGGNAVLVTDWGLTDSLEVKRDKEGNLIGIECYLPASSRALFEPLMDENGMLDIRKLQEAGLDKAIGYRIPTEGKYSMAPLIIKGFLPQQNGSVIMLPSDITRISGCNFEIDKLFLMLNSFRVKSVFKRNEFKRYILDNFDGIKAWDRGQISASNESQTSGRINMFLDQLEAGITDFDSGSVEEHLYKFYLAYKETFTENKITRITYDRGKPAREQSKAARDNMILELSFGALTSPEGDAQLSRPGNFDNVAAAADMARVYRNPDNIMEFLERLGEDTIIEHINSDTATRQDIIDIARLLLNEKNRKFVSEIAKKDKSNIDTLQPTTFTHFHKASVIGGKTIGIYANSNTHFAKTQNTGLALKEPITLFGKSGTELDRINYMGHKVSETLAEYSAASVDDAKEQNLEPLNQNANTAKVTALLGRLGYSPYEMGIFMTSTPFIKDAYIKGDPQATVSLEELLAYNIVDSLGINVAVINKAQVAQMYYTARKIKSAAYSLSRYIQECRADSPNGALENTQGAAAMQIIRAHTLKYLIGRDLEYDNKATLNRKDILDLWNNPEAIADECMKSSMPMLAAFRAMGIDATAPALKDIVLGMSDNMMDILTIFTMYSPSLNLPDELAEKIINYYVIYRLSETKLFGDEEGRTMEEKRRYYVREFPQKCIKLLQEHPEITKNNRFLSKIGYDTKKKVITMPSPSEFDSTVVEEIKTAALNLFYGSEIEQQMAYDLLMYSYYHDGLQYAARSITPYIMTTDYMSNFPELVSSLRHIADTEPAHIRGVKTTEYMEQIVRCLGVSQFSLPIYQSLMYGLPDGVHRRGRSLVVDSKVYKNLINKAGNRVEYVTVRTEAPGSRGASEEYYKLSSANGEVYTYNQVIGKPSSVPFFKVGGKGAYLIRDIFLNPCPTSTIYFVSLPH